ncbi:response regulator [Candidatus Saganbacteria bacterium]|uniref:Response regulator n=1 Tax=Candidatus Saganbacteria bacterium TaxID=2575572 RepID=A0A9D6YVT0_UNCSA|nr:response regulator [Candidatus Saganbacteria bacterium]
MSNPLIMVVDDEEYVSNSIANIIKYTKKYEVITVYSATEAMEQLAKNKIFMGLGGNRIKLLVLDIKMPGMDGLQLLEIIRHDYGEDIGVTMLTAWEDEEKWDRATSGFVINYLKKPFKSEDLLSTIEDFFGGKSSKMVLDTFEKHLGKREEWEKGEAAKK